MARIYVACLAAYNAGHLHGVWIDATSDADEMNEQVQAMIAKSPVQDAEEYAIHDTDGIDVSEHASLADVAARVRLAEDLDDAGNGEEILDAFENCFGEHSTKGIDADTIRDAYCGAFDDKLQFAEQVADDIDLFGNAATTLEIYFDWEAWARDLFMTDYVMHDRHVFRRDW